MSLPLNLFHVGGVAFTGALARSLLTNPKGWKEVFTSKSLIWRDTDTTKFYANSEMSKLSDKMFKGLIKDLNPVYRTQLMENFHHLPPEKKDNLFKQFKSLYEDYDTFKFAKQQAHKLTPNAGKLETLINEENIIISKFKNISKELYRDLALQEGIKKHEKNEIRILKNLNKSVEHMKLLTENEASDKEIHQARETIANHFDELCTELGHDSTEMLEKLEKFYEHHQDYEKAKKFSYTDSTEWALISNALNTLGCGLASLGIVWAIKYYEKEDVEARQKIKKVKELNEEMITNRQRKISDIKLRLELIELDLSYPEVYEKVSKERRIKRTQR